MKRILVSLVMILMASCLHGQVLTSNILGLTVGKSYSESSAKSAIKAPGSRVASARSESSNIAIKGTFTFLDKEWSDIVLLSRGKGGIVFRCNCSSKDAAQQMYQELILSANSAYSRSRRVNDHACLFYGDDNVELMMQILPGQENTISLYFTKN